ncbi:hypothetical protein FA10DRAFT_292593 [Acaromyces ingoldii]|uniref:Uncharacterized protein n=1 Tax=Acaromyces ingoldii TaxID=215250 RepID=A0A316YSY9_9BASI|nr:hypothetical protein FA10DRAFT_292593 [Acaromyces ingoldii]PWN91788.1 hypothetical protein FA10DRAFT_292593 [Acaromyces ingoldii]
MMPSSPSVVLGHGLVNNVSAGKVHDTIYIATFCPQYRHRDKMQPHSLPLLILIIVLLTTRQAFSQPLVESKCASPQASNSALHKRGACLSSKNKEALALKKRPKLIIPQKHLILAWLDLNIPQEHLVPAWSDLSIPQKHLVPAWSDLKTAKGNCADVRNVPIKDANVDDVNINDVNINDTNINDANIKDTSIKDASVKCANVKNVDVKDADMEDMIIKRMKLKDTKPIILEARATCLQAPLCLLRN